MPKKPTNKPGPHKEFAARLLDSLIASNLSPEQNTREKLGNLFGVSGGFISDMLNGHKLPSMENSILIAGKLGVCVEWLLTGIGPRTTSDRNKECFPGLNQDQIATVESIISAFQKSA